MQIEVQIYLPFYARVYDQLTDKQLSLSIHQIAVFGVGITPNSNMAEIQSDTQYYLPKPFRGVEKMITGLNGNAE